MFAKLQPIDELIKQLDEVGGNCPNKSFVGSVPDDLLDQFGVCGTADRCRVIFGISNRLLLPSVTTPADHSEWTGKAIAESFNVKIVGENG